MPHHFVHPTIVQLSDALRTGRTSCVEVIGELLERIVQYDSQLHSFVHVLRDSALQAAAEADRDIKAGNWRGPLHGIPVGIKDIIDVAGAPTLANSATRRGHIAAQDAAVTAALKAAGAIVLGKTATAEYAVGGTQFDALGPPTRNPWDTRLDPGNSSCGSAVAIAAGFCAGAIGTDTGGSIRNPSAWCGLAGLKPTFGSVNREGVLPYSTSLDHVGPMAWTVQDCAILFDAIRRPDPARREPGAHERIGAPINGIRVGILRYLYEDDPAIDGEVIQAFEASLEVLRALGTKPSDVTLGPIDEYHATAHLIARPEGYAQYEQQITTAPNLFGSATLSRLGEGAAVRAHDYINARKRQAELIAHIGQVMTDIDVLVVPTAKFPAQPLGFDALAPGNPFFNRPFNLTGNPALALCNGFTASGLPLSLQIIGRHNEDNLVLQVGHAVETALDNRRRRPPIGID